MAFQDRYAYDGYGENQGERRVVAFGAVQRDHHGAQIVKMIPAKTIAATRCIAPSFDQRFATRLFKPLFLLNVA